MERRRCDELRGGIARISLTVIQFQHFDRRSGRKIDIFEIDPKDIGIKRRFIKIDFAFLVGRPPYYSQWADGVEAHYI